MSDTFKHGLDRCIYPLVCRIDLQGMRTDLELCMHLGSICGSPRIQGSGHAGEITSPDVLAFKFMSFSARDHCRSVSTAYYRQNTNKTSAIQRTRSKDTHTSGHLTPHHEYPQQSGSPSIQDETLANRGDAHLPFSFPVLAF